MYSPKPRQPARRKPLPVFLRARAPAMRLSAGDWKGTIWFRTRGVPHAARACTGCRNGSPALHPCFRPVIYREPYNSSVSAWIGCASGGATAAYGASKLRRQQDLAAGGRQIGHPRPRLGLRRRRRPRVEHGIGEPIRELLVAAVVRRSRRLRFAFRAVGRADEPNVEMKVVSPPRLHLAEPMAVAAGVAAQGFLDRSVDEDAGDLRVLRRGADHR